MAQNITLMGASYPSVPAVTLPKTGGGSALFVDPSPVTAVAADVAQGKYFIDSNGDLVEGSGSGGGGGPSYTLTTIAPQQTVVSTSPPAGDQDMLPLTSSEGLIEGDYYLVTVNGVVRAQTAVRNNYVLYLSDIQDCWYGGNRTVIMASNTLYFCPWEAGTYTVKVEHLELDSGGGGGSTLIEKSITANGTYNASDDSADGYSKVTVNVSGGSVNIGTVTTTNSNNQNASISFTLPAGRTPKAFFCRLTSQIARNSGSRYYYVYDMRWDGSSNGGVAGNTFYMYNGTLTNVTSGYSYSQSGTTFTLASTGSRSASPGSFFNGTYELVYVY